MECILIDEVQDCLREEVDVYMRLAKDVFFAGDDRQKIYSGEDVIPTLESQLTTKRLIHHYRNGHEVCRVVDAIGTAAGNPPILPSSNYVEAANPSKVEFVACADASDQAARVIAKLSTEMKAYPGEMLGVGCPIGAEVEVLRDAIAASPLAPYLIQGKDFSSTDEVIYVSTLHDIKGLEFRCMHLASMQLVWKLREAQKRAAFTAATRAKTLLSLYSYGKDVPGFLQQAREVTVPRKAPPNPSDLFPRKKRP